MPTYEYVCNRCGKRLEVFQSFSDKPLTTHEDCGGRLEKVIHSRGVIFKGSGFYSTDSKPKKADSKKKASPKEGASSEASED